MPPPAEETPCPSPSPPLEGAGGGADPNVIMIRPDLDNIPDFALPDGYGFRPLGPGDAGLWTDIWRDADPSLSIGDDLFTREFGSDWKVIGERCFLIVDSKGRAVGTNSAWFDPAFRGLDYGRVHWLAVRRACQGKGLARPAMSFVLRTLARWHTRCYLRTQVHRLRAIKVYLDFGFRPDVPDSQMEQAWSYVRGRLGAPGLRRH